MKMLKSFLTLRFTILPKIQSGVTITLTSTLNMAKDKYILIRPGAKLIVDGGKITNKCGEMWAGIIVEGDPAQHQFADASGNYLHGYVACRNGATIEYAHSAIRLWNPITGDAMGGIVKATNSKFLNNRRSLEFMPYQNFDPNTGNLARNAAYIRNCTFKIDDNYRRPDFYAHVSAWRVDGVRFVKCHFENAKTIGINVAQDLGTGIYTIDAGFSVKGHCDYTNVPAPGTNPPCPFEDIEPSVFKNLYYGIRADKEGSMNTYTVHGCRFENNIRGIESNGVDFSSILQNQFLVGGNPYLVAPANGAFPIHEGIIVNTGSAYTIEENRMDEVATNGAFRYTVGTS